MLASWRFLLAICVASLVALCIVAAPLGHRIILDTDLLFEGQVALDIEQVPPTEAKPPTRPPPAPPKPPTRPPPKPPPKQTKTTPTRPAPTTTKKTTPPKPTTTKTTSTEPAPTPTKTTPTRPAPTTTKKTTLPKPTTTKTTSTEPAPPPTKTTHRPEPTTTKKTPPTKPTITKTPRTRPAPPIKLLTGPTRPPRPPPKPTPTRPVPTRPVPTRLPRPPPKPTPTRPVPTRKPAPTTKPTPTTKPATTKKPTPTVKPRKPTETCVVRRAFPEYVPRGAAGVAPRALPSGETWISLVREHINTDHEHWALFFHSPPTGKGTASSPYVSTGTLMDAVYDPGNPKAPLEVDLRLNKKRGYPNIRKDGTRDTIDFLGEVKTGKYAQQLLDLAMVQAAPKKGPLEQNGENCVDFVKHAVDVIAHVDASAVDAKLFHSIYDKNYADVRKRTDCNFACISGGD